MNEHILRALELPIHSQRYSVRGQVVWIQRSCMLLKKTETKTMLISLRIIGLDATSSVDT